MKVEIDLAEHGLEGRIVMGPPPYRRYVEMQNVVSRTAAVKGGRIEGVLGGDAALLGVLMYVLEAPFKPTVDGWLAWCDSVEPEHPYAPYAVMDAMTEAVGRIDGDADSPFGR